MTLPKFSKTTVSSYVGGFFLLCGLIANCPSELQALIMKAFPEFIRPYAAIVFGVAAYLTIIYKGHKTQDVETKPDPVSTDPAAGQPRGERVASDDPL